MTGKITPSKADEDLALSNIEPFPLDGIEDLADLGFGGTHSCKADLNTVSCSSDETGSGGRLVRSFNPKCLKNSVVVP